MKERLIGVILLICGVTVGYLCVYLPLESARSGTPTVSVSLKGTVLTPFALVGMMYLVLGSRATEVMGTREKPKPAAFAVMVGALLLGVGLYVWLRSALQDYGYDFRGQI
jgi:hypothetical protein